MATYGKIPQVPSLQRSQSITDVAVGDQIDLTQVLGRPARGIIMYTSSSTDEVQYRLNSLKKVWYKRQDDLDVTLGEYHEFWRIGDGFPVFESTGDTIQTADGLQISSIEIVALTLDSGTTIEIVCW